MLESDRNLLKKILSQIGKCSLWDPGVSPDSVIELSRRLSQNDPTWKCFISTLKNVDETVCTNFTSLLEDSAIYLNAENKENALRLLRNIFLHNDRQEAFKTDIDKRHGSHIGECPNSRQELDENEDCNEFVCLGSTPISQRSPSQAKTSPAIEAIENEHHESLREFDKPLVGAELFPGHTPESSKCCNSEQPPNSNSASRPLMVRNSQTAAEWKLNEILHTTTNAFQTGWDFPSRIEVISNDVIDSETIASLDQKLATVFCDSRIASAALGIDLFAYN